jgi:transcription initiation factor TFIIIB Brf1 subunit/transcription initiation factor TFIIB
MGNELNLDARTVDFAVKLYDKVTHMKEIQLSRISTISVAVACVYISSALNNKRKVTQYELTYKFKVSPTTIRKAYKKVCKLAGINEDKVLEGTGQYV